MDKETVVYVLAADVSSYVTPSSIPIRALRPPDIRHNQICSPVFGWERQRTLFFSYTGSLLQGKYEIFLTVDFFLEVKLDIVHNTPRRMTNVSWVHNIDQVH